MAPFPSEGLVCRWLMVCIWYWYSPARYTNLERLAVSLTLAHRDVLDFLTESSTAALTGAMPPSLLPDEGELVTHTA